MPPVDVSQLTWEGGRTRCPACRRPTALLLVLGSGALRCPSCARAAGTSLSCGELRRNHGETSAPAVRTIPPGRVRIDPLAGARPAGGGLQAHPAEGYGADRRAVRSLARRRAEHLAEQKRAGRLEVNAWPQA
jgi:hypothetical protein